MHKIFSFKGITRNTDNLMAAEGECVDIVNMRMKDGVLVPMPELSQVTRLVAEFEQIYWHELAQCYLAVIADSDGRIMVFDKEWHTVNGTDGEPFYITGIPNIYNMEFLGYVACCMTTEGIYYLLYSNGKYIFLGERPPMPVLNISTESIVESVTTDAEYEHNVSKGIESSWAYNSKGYFDEAINTLNKKGYYIDRAMFCFALRLFDGSYISVSPVMYVSDESRVQDIMRDEYNLVAEPVGSSIPSRYKVKVLGMKPAFSFTALTLGNWKDIVAGIDVFTTGSIMGKKVVPHRKDNNVGEGVYDDKDFEELYTEVSEASLYYRVAEYDIDGNLVFCVNDVSRTNLVLQQSLSYERCSYSSFVPGCSYVFNNRLHLGAIKEFFGKGHNSMMFSIPNSSSETLGRICVKTKIRTIAGVSVVARVYENVAVALNDGVYELPPLLSYPDSRAFEMTLFLFLNSNVYRRTFQLAAHRFLNQAQYLNRASLGYVVAVRSAFQNGAELLPLTDKEFLDIFSWQAGSYKLTYSKTDGTWLLDGEPFYGTDELAVELVYNERLLADGDTIIVTITESDDAESDITNIALDNSWEVLQPDEADLSESVPYEERLNVLKVSSVDNPFSFPARCTYSPSHTEIVALASNTVALSQGQFGQHPLYVFCRDGIWAMSVDTSGAMAYLASFPLSREVCVNAGSVCGVDSGVAFVGEQGVMLISGGKIKTLSSCMIDNGGTTRILDNMVIRGVASMMGLAGVKENGDFSGYMRSASLVYLPEHAEILLGSASHSYSYLFSLQSGVWSRLGVKVEGLVKRCRKPYIFSADSGRTTLFAIDTAQSGDNNVFVVSRPHLWGSKMFKRITTLMLHAYVKPCNDLADGVPALACYLFGSNDGANYKLLSGREIVREAQDIILPFYPTQSYRSFVFVVCGKMMAGSVLTGVEVEVQSAWNSRIR